MGMGQGQAFPVAVPVSVVKMRPHPCPVGYLWGDWVRRGFLTIGGHWVALAFALVTQISGPGMMLYHVQYTYVKLLIIQKKILIILNDNTL